MNTLIAVNGFELVLYPYACPDFDLGVSSATVFFFLFSPFTALLPVLRKDAVNNSTSCLSFLFCSSIPFSFSWHPNHPPFLLVEASHSFLLVLPPLCDTDTEVDIPFSRLHASSFSPSPLVLDCCLGLDDYSSLGDNTPFWFGHYC